MTTLNITTAEWQLARSVVLAAAPSETDPSAGVAVFVADGERWWTAWNGDLAVTTNAFPAPEDIDGVATISPRVVMAGARLEDGAELVFTDVGATVQGGDTAFSFEIPAPREIPTWPAPGNAAATADVLAGDLWELLDVAGVLPDGVDLDHIAPPPFLLSIENGRIAARVDWSDAGVPGIHVGVTAETSGVETCPVWPSLTKRVLSSADPMDRVRLVVPDSGETVMLESVDWSAHIRTSMRPANEPTLDEWIQLQLFDTGGFAPKKADPFAGWSLTDLRALAVDPDSAIRIQATQSKWNWDLRVQQVLATDPDERVVLALLDETDPYVEVCEMIIAGPHAAARRRLLDKNLRSELVELLAEDDDPLTAERAARILADRGVRELPDDRRIVTQITCVSPRPLLT